MPTFRRRYALLKIKEGIKKVKENIVNKISKKNKKNNK